MILRGGYYDSFGKKDDGLGYAPITTSNDHGSTGIAGVVAYDGGNFPAEYTGSMFVGNVVTNIIHRDTLSNGGVPPRGLKRSRILSRATTGGSTRWICNSVPDGALYVSDFYNSIIGHYEVDLKHPRRDRHRGRIWRIVYTGTDQKVPAPAVPNLHALPIEELVARLADSNATVRNLAGQDLQARFATEAPDRARSLLEQQLSATESAPHAAARVQALWLLWRLEKLDAGLIQRLGTDPACPGPHAPHAGIG